MKTRIRRRAALATLLSLPFLPGQLEGQAATPRSHSISTPVALGFETYRLENGLTVTLSRDTSTPLVAVNLWYHVGSANEEPGRTGFAHLFEHMMFQGSQNVGDDAHFRLIQEAGGTLNGSTTSDRTNYYQAVPSNFLERVLWQEADRMGFLLPTLTQEKLDNQRSVVQNERRQNVDNVPYGLASETILAALYPDGHPYSWPVIGSLADLDAASLEDVEAFFRRYYAPNNAFLSIVGDFDTVRTKEWIELYFGSFPPGPGIERPEAVPVSLSGEKRLVLEDRVQLPRLQIVWPTPPRFHEGDAELGFLGDILAGGRSSRLYQRLVYEEQLAQGVSAGQGSRSIASQFTIVVQARPGVDLTRVLRIVDEEVEKLRRSPPDEREVQAALNRREAAFIQQMQTVLNRADVLNMYAVFTGDPGYLERDVMRYRDVTAAGVLDVARRYLGPDRVILSVVPQGERQLQALGTP